MQPWVLASVPPRGRHGLAAGQGQGRVDMAAGASPAHGEQTKVGGGLPLPPTLPGGKQPTPLLPPLSSFLTLASVPWQGWLLRCSPHIRYSRRPLEDRHQLAQETGRVIWVPTQDLDMGHPACAPPAVPRASQGGAPSPNTTRFSAPPPPPHLLIFQTF